MHPIIQSVVDLNLRVELHTLVKHRSKAVMIKKKAQVSGLHYSTQLKYEVQTPSHYIPMARE